MQISENSDAWRSPIEIMPLIQAFPDLQRLSEMDSIAGGASEVKKFAQKKVVISRDHDRLFGVFSGKAVVVPHEEALDIIGTAYRAMYGGEPNIELVSMKQGAQIRAKIRLPDEPGIDIGNGDTSDMMLFLYNSYDGALPFKLRAGLFRQVCLNGAVVGDTIACLTAAQLMEGWNAKTLGDRINKMITDTRKVADVWRQWTQVQIPYGLAERALEFRFPKKMLEPILDPEQFPMSKYELYNLMTRRATHDSRTERAQVAFDTSIASIFYGKKSPLRLAEQAAGIEDDEVADLVTETEDIRH